MRSINFYFKIKDVFLQKPQVSAWKAITRLDGYIKVSGKQSCAQSAFHYLVPYLAIFQTAI